MVSYNLKEDQKINQNYLVEASKTLNEKSSS